MAKQCDFKKEIEVNVDKMAQELKDGKDIIIKSTVKGIKIQSLKVNTLNKNND